MPSGGLRPGSGRPPKENSRAKERAARAAARAGIPFVDDGDWLTLPREGRKGNPPAWPLTKASTRERELWRREWKRPQATAWERLCLDSQVAIYVRTLARAEQDESAIGLLNLVRQQQDGLGLTAAGMKMLHWRIGQHRGQTEQPPAPSSPPLTQQGATAPKHRLQVVQGG